eukprot:m.47936 g.47936  ORF g.47936 m.47936 type:complete len:135 (-) comp11956_c0_seq3:68-472(-)
MGRLNTYLLQAAAMAAGAGALYVSRPDRDSFRPFLTRWLKDKLKARQASSASSSTSSFLDGVSQWFDTQVSAVTAEGLAATAQIEFGSYKLFEVAVVQLPGQDELLVFVGAATTWIHMPGSVGAHIASAAAQPQ